MLAHKATHEAKVAAEVIAGENVAFEPRAIPSVAYTDPEVAWMGLTETQAKADGTEVETAVFPWAASGRALGMGRPEGMTKLVLEPGDKRLLGAGIVGVNAGELIAELVHALEMGADAEDIGLTIHPHPTLSESVGMAAEVGTGTITDLPPKRAKARSLASNAWLRPRSGSRSSRTTAPSTPATGSSSSSTTPRRASCAAASRCATSC